MIAPAHPHPLAVLLYLPQLKVGGAEISMLRLAQGLRDRGLRVAFAVHVADAMARELAGDIELISLHAARTLGAASKLARLLRKRRPDLLISALTHANIIAVVAARLSGTATKVIVSEHAPVSSMALLDRSFSYRITLSMMPLLYRWAHALVAVSQGVADDVAPLLDVRTRSRLWVIANPVLRGDWQALARQTVAESWFEEGSVPVVLAVGRLSPEKNFDRLIHAFAAMEGATPARLVIVGEGPAREGLQALIDHLGLGSRVHLPGRRDNPFAYMQRATVFVLASRFEGFGNVLIEAMACGTPVVSTDCPVGPREILCDGLHGKLVAVDDTPALTAAINAQLQHPQATPAARERALQFTVERSVERYLELFERLCAEQASTPCC